MATPALNRVDAFPIHIALHPKYWGGLLALAALRVLAAVPLSLGRLVGGVLGMLMYHSNRKRREIARTNLRLCFPEKSAADREVLLKAHFKVAGRGFVDLGFIAWAAENRFRNKVRVVGAEHVQQAMVRGRHVILLAPHCVGMNVGGIAVAGRSAVFSMYKPQRNPLVNWLLNRGRSRYDSPLVARAEGLRPVLRWLQKGWIFYYLPDEDLGPKHSVFVPFFGIPTATLPTLGRLAHSANAEVIPCFTRLLPKGAGYEVILAEPLQNFPTGDRLADAARMNEELERGIREMPEQYMWTFKLFKTRPEGERSPYG